MLHGVAADEDASVRILIVDDDAAMCAMLERGLAAPGVTTMARSNGSDALEVFRSEDIDVVVTDVRMRGQSGLDLCRQMVEARSDVPVIVVTAFGNMSTAVEALRAGAFDFVTKPFDLPILRAAVGRAAERRRLGQRVRRLERALDEARGPSVLIGRSPAIGAVSELIERVADAPTTVLITGESGTGKELVARSLHDRSRRRARPFVAVNCAAMPASLLEAELFGYVRGAFTDARADRSGLFQSADGGTLFLDEIGELPLELQPKLLRALQERAVRPVGGTQEIPFDVRVVTATHLDLAAAVADGRFRADLYYRIHVVDIHVPPLRVRDNDVLLLAQHFVRHYAKAAGKQITGISPAAARQLFTYRWPGNVRELQNCIERAVTLARFSEIGLDDLPQRIRDSDQPAVVLEPSPDAIVPMEEIERRYVHHVYETTGRNKSLTATLLGFNRKTLYRKLERYGMLAPSEVSSEDEPSGAT